MVCTDSAGNSISRLHAGTGSALNQLQNSDGS